ncbi:MAG: CRISPR-associated endonuclease Cas2 [Treponema sp.]|nr:CRISPR-associated endonuclease Cas2 [Treponema sp.]
MRIIVMLNPSNKYGTKSAYTELRKFLIKYGYLLLQPEVEFMRVENTKKNCIKHQNRIKEFLPKTGTVRMLI